MWVWGKANGEAKETATVARSAVEGKPRHDLLREAVRTLLASGRVDRAGVWIESIEGNSADSSEVASFRGIVADKDGDATPAEWSRLSPEAPLPVELLIGLQTVAQEPAPSPGGPLIGAVVGMQSALWVPVQMHGRLRGVLFAGGRKKQAHLPQVLLESVAAELALTLELEDERRLGRESREDSRHVLAALAGSESPSDILAGLVKDCTHMGVHEGGPNAVFAVIGCLVNSPKTVKQSIDPAGESMRFAWQSGAAGWIRALESEPLSGVWRLALETHRVVGSEPGAASFRGQVARVVALPLEAGGESLGVLVAGIRRSSTCLAVVERLELRAALATSVLLRQKHSEETADLELRHKEVLAALEKQPERSERAQAEHGITEIRNVIEWIEEGVVLFGASQEIRAMNSRFGQIVGLAPEELSGIKTLDDLVGSLSARTADASAFAESWHTLARSTEGALREELHLVRPVPRVVDTCAPHR
jgi:PAS domain-containing protein